MNQGGRSCSEPRLCHCTPAWATRAKLHLKKKERKKQRKENAQRCGVLTMSRSDLPGPGAGSFRSPCRHFSSVSVFSFGPLQRPEDRPRQTNQKWSRLLPFSVSLPHCSSGLTLQHLQMPPYAQTSLEAPLADSWRQTMSHTFCLFFFFLGNLI